MSVCTEADELINGQRAEDYGDAKESFQRIASIWSAVLCHTVTPHEVCLCMIGLKLSRLASQPTHHDSQVDVCGYAALLQKLS